MTRLAPALLLTLGITLVALPFAADGGPYQAYQELTRAERRLALRYFWQLPSVYGAATFARSASQSRYPQLSGQDDQRDAHRHSTWNGSMTRRLKSRTSAKRWGDAHEEIPNNPAQRKQMDLTNNATGRDVTWAARRRTGPWWWRTTRFPSDAEIANTMQTRVNGGGLVMVEEVNGQRHPHNGALVPTTRP